MDDMQDQDEVQPAKYGYGKFYRAVTHSPVFVDIHLLQLYIVIGRDAAIVERWVQIPTGRGYASVHLMPGEYLSRRQSSAAMLGWDEDTYRKRLEKLIKYGLVKVVRRTTHGTVLILNDFSDSSIDSSANITTQKRGGLPTKNGKTLPPKNKEKASLFVDEDESEVGSVTTLNDDSLPPFYQPNTTLVPPLEKCIKGKEKKEKKNKGFDALAVELPESMRTDTCKMAWSEWCQHRKQISKPLTELACRKQLSALQDWNESRVIEAINYSILKGWQTIYERNNGSTTTATTFVPCEHHYPEPSKEKPGICKEQLSKVSKLPLVKEDE